MAEIRSASLSLACACGRLRTVVIGVRASVPWSSGDELPPAPPAWGDDAKALIEEFEQSHECDANRLVFQPEPSSSVRLAAVPETSEQRAKGR